MSNILPLVFPGFKTLSDQVFVRDGDRREDEDTSPPDHPRVVIIYGWGDGLPKHVSKYSDGFCRLYPHAKQIIVLSPIFKTMRQSLHRRSQSMMVVVEEAFRDSVEDSVLIHVMSNTGGINYASTIKAYSQRYGQPLPHRLTILDSAPGSYTFTWHNLICWSYAMALGTAAVFPWPFAFTQFICGAYLCANRLVDNILRQESAQAFSLRVLVDGNFESLSAERLYLYGKKDDIIAWADIEDHCAQAEKARYEVESVLFSDSGHVGHMRLHPEKYWGAVDGAWRNAIHDK
ncbi:hypothetical protein ACHAPJ_011209 [Fusarium lateritium]